MSVSAIFWHFSLIWYSTLPYNEIFPLNKEKQRTYNPVMISQLLPGNLFYLNTHTVQVEIYELKTVKNICAVLRPHRPSAATLII